MLVCNMTMSCLIFFLLKKTCSGSSVKVKNGQHFAHFLSQMAQNILLSWLGGSRIMELKTVQVLDELEIPRPCIDMQTVGYNVEWSQELKVEQSLHEYVKGSMLIQILQASGKLELATNFKNVLYDMSVGYDLNGIKSEKVCQFIEKMKDASDIVEQYRKEIPEYYAEYRDLDFQTRLSDTLTLSTFHGCPPDEIETVSYTHLTLPTKA